MLLGEQLFPIGQVLSVAHPLHVAAQVSLSFHPLPLPRDLYPTYVCVCFFFISVGATV